MSLILISSEPIRKKWVSQYHQIEKKLAKLKRDWNIFEDEAQTQYQQWYHQSFAEQLSQLTQTGEEIHELRTTLSAVQAHIEVRRISKKAAFEYVMDAIKNKKDPFPAEAEIDAFRTEQKKAYEKEFKASHSRSGKEEIDSDLLERARAMVLEQVRRQYPYPPENPIEAMLLNREINEAIHETYGRLKNNSYADPYEKGWDEQDDEDYDFDFKNPFGFDDDEEKGDEPNPQSAQKAEETLARDKPKIDDYKLIYRKIVKRLHPDRGEEMSREEKTLWSEAQRAYRDKNTEALKTILLRAEGDGTIKIDQVPAIGDMIEIVYSLNAEVEEITYLKKRTKKEWVYRFWASKNRKNNREKLAAEIEKQLGQQLSHARYQLRDLKEEFKELKNAREKKTKPPRRK